MNNKITYYYMDDKGVKSKQMTKEEYDKLIEKIYDKENILNYIEDELIAYGIKDPTASLIIHKAKEIPSLYEDLNEFMKEKNRIKKSAIVASILDNLEVYDSNG